MKTSIFGRAQMGKTEEVNSWMTCHQISYDRQDVHGPKRINQNDFDIFFFFEQIF